MTRQRCSWVGQLSLALLAYAALSGAPNDRPPKGEWWYYAGDLASTKYSPLEQINRANVSHLRVAWRRPQINPDLAAASPNLRLSNNYRSTPIMAGGVLYATNDVGLAEAFDPETGRTVWSQKPDGDLTGNPGLGGALRAVAYWKDGSDGRILYKGKQYVVLAIGGSDRPAEFAALSLP